MIRHRVLAPAFTLLIAACATTPRSDVEPAPQSAVMVAPAPAPFDAVGEYTFTVDMQGDIVGGTMVLTRTVNGSLAGRMFSDHGSVVFSSATLEGRRLRATGPLDNGPELTFVIDFVGADDFTGTFSTQGAGGTISGTRKKA